MFVSQPLLALSFSLIFGFLAAAAVASSALARTRKSRAFRLIAFATAIIVVGRVTAASGLHFNVTPSMPLGIYRLVPVPKSGVQPGMFVAVCAPIDAARLGRRRGYLANGRCAADTEPLVKVAAAVAGDEVTISSRGVAVNGCLLPHSRPLKFDSAGRPLLALATWTLSLVTTRPTLALCWKRSKLGLSLLGYACRLARSQRGARPVCSP